MELTREIFDYCGDYILKNGRLLERELFKHYFINENEQNVLRALKHYQNPDGGFGHGIEPDALLPLSSPFQTSVGLSYLTSFDQSKEALIMIKIAISYLEETFDEKRYGWISLPKEVNNYPHTIWWEFDNKKKMTPIDKHYGNPTAEILSYLLRYKNYVTSLNLKDLTEYVLNYIENKESFQSEHELYCFIKLYDVLEGKAKKRLEKQLTKGIHQLIVYDREQWKTSYVPKPIDFVKDPKENHFDIDLQQIEINLDCMIQALNEHKRIIPSWGDQFYQGEFKNSFTYWSVIKTLEALIIIKNYHRFSWLRDKKIS